MWMPSPVVPCGPCGPWTPGSPFGPAAPCAPVAPAGPWLPVGPVGPGTVEAGPVAPCGPLMLPRTVHVDESVFSYTMPDDVLRYQSPTEPIEMVGAVVPPDHPSATPSTPGSPCGPMRLPRTVHVDVPVFSEKPPVVAFRCQSPTMPRLGVGVPKLLYQTSPLSPFGPVVPGAPGSPCGPLMFPRSVHAEVPVFSETSPVVVLRYQSPTAPSVELGAVVPLDHPSACPVAPVGPIGPAGPVGPGTVEAGPVGPVGPVGPAGPVGPGTVESAPGGPGGPAGPTPPVCVTVTERF